MALSIRCSMACASPQEPWGLPAGVSSVALRTHYGIAQRWVWSRAIGSGSPSGYPDLLRAAESHRGNHQTGVASEEGGPLR
jgi:hypothetical protein